MVVLWSLTCAAVIPSMLQENNLSISIPQRVKCRTEAVKKLSRSVETLKMLKSILSNLKWANYRNQWYHTKLCFNINLAICGLPPNMKSSSHKTWRTSLLFYALSKYKTEREKIGGTWHIMSPRLKEWGDTSPVSPTKLRPCHTQSLRARRPEITP